MANFAVGNASLGSSTGYTSTADGYMSAKNRISSMLASNQKPSLYGCSVQDIELVAGPFTPAEQEKLKNYGLK